MCRKLDDSTSSSNSLTDPAGFDLSSPNNTSSLSSSAPDAMASDAISASSTRKKTVSFSNIQVAQYPMELGDNPSASGLPLTIGWECDFKLNFELEEYETSKPEPRTRDQFWMPPRHREELLWKQGVSPSEMRRTSKEMKRIQKSRHRSIKNQKWDSVNLVLEKSGRKLKRITSLTNLKRTTSSSSLLSQHSEGFSSPSVNTTKRRPRSMSMSMLISKWQPSCEPLDEADPKPTTNRTRMPRSTSMSMLTSKWRSSGNNYQSRDPLDESNPAARKRKPRSMSMSLQSSGNNYPPGELLEESDANKHPQGMRMPRSTSMSMLTSKWRNNSGDGKRCSSPDPLDEAAKSRIAVHLLQHPEDLLVDDSEEQTEDLMADDSEFTEDVSPTSSPAGRHQGKLIHKFSSIQVLGDPLDTCRESLSKEDLLLTEHSETPTAELSDPTLGTVNIQAVKDDEEDNSAIWI